jgi:transglutaminase-like putative cysteine protease
VSAKLQGGANESLRRFTVDCNLKYEVQSPSHFVFQVEAVESGQLVLDEALTLTPPVSVQRHTHGPSNNRLLRADVLPGLFELNYRATVELQPPLPHGAGLPESPVSGIPFDYIHLLSPTRYCESDLLASATKKMFSQHAPGWERVEGVRQWIHDNIEYTVGSTTTTSTACDVFLQRAGVCRDFAHLGIAFCRALNIPARFVVGYVKFPEGVPDFHAVFEAWLGNRWVLFDATDMAPIDELIRVGTGRDAKDVPFATFFGDARMLSMSPSVETVATAAPSAPSAPPAPRPHLARPVYAV